MQMTADGCNWCIRIFWIQLLVILTVSGLTAQAQNVRFRSRAQIDSLLNPALMKGGEDILRFDSTVRHIGTLTEDDPPVSCKFVCTNVSGRPVGLARVRTTCSCLKAVYRKETVAPGESLEIELVYIPENHPGTVDSDAFVYLSGADNVPVARLKLVGNVLPGADRWERFPFFMGNLRLKQKSVEIRFADGEKVSERILCANGGDGPLRLSARMIPEFARFHTEPEVIHEGSEGDIVITVEKKRLPQRKGNEFCFPIVVDGVDGRPSDRTINVKVIVSENNK